jgi:hypothetical protein
LKRAFEGGLGKYIEIRTGFEVGPLQPENVEFCSLCNLFVRAYLNAPNCPGLQLNDLVIRGHWLGVRGFREWEFNHSSALCLKITIRATEFPRSQAAVSFYLRPLCIPDPNYPGQIQPIRYFARLIELPEIPISLVTSWLARCKEKHSVCNKPFVTFNKEQFEGFQLIDVQDRCVVSAPDLPPFFTLSYVWGTFHSMQQQARERTLDFSKPGSLTEDQVPRTIRDAMKLTLAFHERYLWVDYLCIPQNDDKVKFDLIQTMDVIYSRAELVIIAAEGSHADVGLTGVGGARAISQVRFPISPGFMLCAQYDVHNHIRKSTYAERGWT